MSVHYLQTTPHRGYWRQNSAECLAETFSCRNVWRDS